jgi:hypothetical protein
MLHAKLFGAFQAHMHGMQCARIRTLRIAYPKYTIVEHAASAPRATPPILKWRPLQMMQLHRIPIEISDDSERRNPSSYKRLFPPRLKRGRGQHQYQEWNQRSIR